MGLAAAISDGKEVVKRFMDSEGANQPSRSANRTRSGAVPPALPRHKNSGRWRDAANDKKYNLDRRIAVVCCPELERVRPVIVRGSTAPPAQVHQ